MEISIWLGLVARGVLSKIILSIKNWRNIIHISLQILQNTRICVCKWMHPPTAHHCGAWPPPPGHASVDMHLDAVIRQLHIATIRISAWIIRVVWIYFINEHVTTYRECPQTFTSIFREGFRYFVVLQRGHPSSSMLKIVLYVLLLRLFKQRTTLVYLHLTKNT